MQKSIISTMARLASWIVLVAGAFLVSSWAPSFVGSSRFTTAKQSAVARAASDLETVILRMKHKGMSMSDITKATAVNPAKVNELVAAYNLKIRVLKPVMKRLQQRGMDLEEIAEVTDIPDWIVSKTLAAPKTIKKKVSKKSTAAAPAAPDAGKEAVAEAPVAAAAVPDETTAAAVEPVAAE